MHARANINWIFPEEGSVSWEAAQLAVLMDIRHELKRLNTLLYCVNFQGIPHTLKSIDRRLTKPKRKPAAKKNRKD